MIVLRKFGEKDFPRYYSLVGKITVMKMITERAIPIEEARINYKKILINNMIHKSFGSFKVIDDKTKTFFGSAILKIIVPNSDEAEVGYMILPIYWGKGLGNKIAQMLINRAKKEPQLNRLKAYIDPNNIASRKILVNVGFESIGFEKNDGLISEILILDLT